MGNMASGTLGRIKSCRWTTKFWPHCLSGIRQKDWSRSSFYYYQIPYFCFRVEGLHFPLACRIWLGGGISSSFAALLAGVPRALAVRSLSVGFGGIWVVIGPLHIPVASQRTSGCSNSCRQIQECFPQSTSPYPTQINISFAFADNGDYYILVPRWLPGPSQRNLGGGFYYYRANMQARVSLSLNILWMPANDATSLMNALYRVELPGHGIGSRLLHKWYHGLTNLL